MPHPHSRGEAEPGAHRSEDGMEEDAQWSGERVSEVADEERRRDERWPAVADGKGARGGGPT